MTQLGEVTSVIYADTFLNPSSFPLRFQVIEVQKYFVSKSFHLRAHVKELTHVNALGLILSAF
jgi:hypothetical protein